MAESVKVYNDSVEMSKGEERSRRFFDDIDLDQQGINDRTLLEGSSTAEQVGLSVGGRGVNGSSYRRQSSALRSLYTKAKQEAVLQTTRERGELPDHEDENRNRWHARSSKVSKKLYEPLLEQGFVHLEKIIHEKYETIKSYENTIDGLVRENKRLKMSENGSEKVFSILIDEERIDIECKTSKKRKLSKMEFKEELKNQVTSFDDKPLNPEPSITGKADINEADILHAEEQEKSINKSDTIYHNISNISDAPLINCMNIENALSMDELGPCSNDNLEGTSLFSPIPDSFSDDHGQTNYQILNELEDLDIDNFLQ